MTEELFHLLLLVATVLTTAAFESQPQAAAAAAAAAAEGGIGHPLHAQQPRKLLQQPPALPPNPTFENLTGPAIQSQSPQQAGPGGTLLAPIGVLHVETTTLAAQDAPSVYIDATVSPPVATTTGASESGLPAEGSPGTDASVMNATSISAKYAVPLADCAAGEVAIASQCVSRSRFVSQDDDDAEVITVEGRHVRGQHMRSGMTSGARNFIYGSGISVWCWWYYLMLLAALVAVGAP